VIGLPKAVAIEVPVVTEVPVARLAGRTSALENSAAATEALPENAAEVRAAIVAAAREAVSTRTGNVANHRRRCRRSRFPCWPMIKASILSPAKSR
jgi:hypothetical protein